MEIIKLTIVVKEKIEIPNFEKLPMRLRSDIKKALTYNNPEWARNSNMGLSVSNVPQLILTYREINFKNFKTLEADRGEFCRVMRAALKYCEEHDKTLDFKYEDLTVTVPVANMKFTATPMPHQLEALEATKTKKQGIISFPPGGGKTIAALAIIAAKSQRTLVVVHTIALLKQWLENIKKFLPEVKVGRLVSSSSPENMDNDIEIATAQTLTRMNLKPFSDKFGMVILDECHHAPATTFRKTISSFAAAYRYGLSASLSRYDGKQFLMGSVFGKVIIKKSAADLPDRIIKPEVYKVEYPGVLGSALYDERDGKMHLNYSRLYTALADSATRNELIVKLIETCLYEADSVLVLTKRVHHAMELEEILVDLGIKAAAIYGTLPKEKCEEILANVRAGRINVLIGTSIADEGLDIVNLSRLILTMPSSFKEGLNQRIGRISRVANGKTAGKVYDIVDTRIPELTSSWNKRKRAYKGMGLEVFGELSV